VQNFDGKLLGRVSRGLENGIQIKIKKCTRFKISTVVKRELG
jgi:hypothetical protein